MESGHGHVVPRPDGSKARCGGPALCQVCANEQKVYQMFQATLRDIGSNRSTRRALLGRKRRAT